MLGRHALRISACAGAVVAVTAAIYILREGVPVLSLGVLYLFAVLPVAVLWGLGYAIAVAFASMAAFNWFFLHPVHTLSLADSEYWLALAVYVVTAVLVSELAARVRRRATEAEQREREEVFLAELSATLLAGRELEDELEHLEKAIALILQADAARIILGGSPRPSEEHRTYELRADDRLVGTLELSHQDTKRAAVRSRFLSALASLLGVALERERLARQARTAEELRRSDAVKTAVLRAVSHDLRTPLTAIRVAAEGLSNPSLDLSFDDRSALLATIKVEAIRLQRVVGDLLDLSRLEAGATETDPDVWMIDELVAQVLDGLGVDGDRVDVALPPESPLVRVDAVQVERVLANLVENALKFSPPETRVRIEVASDGHEGLIRVVDEGPGVALDSLDAVFEPFRTSANGGHQGTGLGLAIARGFAEANGGRVWIEPPGTRKGTTFVLALPKVETPITLGA